MARPMLLVQEDILSDIWYKHSTGVPILALIRQENLKITSPTLKVLLNYMDALDTLEGSNDAMYQIVYDSLFPEWLTEKEDQTVVQQTKSHRYQGKMPLGKWIRN